MAKGILVADDEEEIIELLKLALEPSGYAVTGTTHGSRLPMLIKKEKPVLLFLDVMLPGIDGYSLALQLSQDKDTMDIPIVVLTALPAARSLFEKIPQVKCFINKPFDSDEVLEKVKTILKE